MKRTGSFLVPVFWLFAGTYLLLIPLRPFFADFLIKAVPVLALAVWALQDLKGKLKFLLPAGFFLSAAGDVALAFHTKEEPRWFIAGLAFFLVAHVLYILAFSLNRKFFSARLPLLILIPVFSGGMIFLLSSKLPAELKIPVFAYITVITLMGIFATLNSIGGFSLIAGALLFILSDSGIAVSAFLLPEGHSYGIYFSYFIMITYYLAQFFIARSFLKSPASFS